MGVFGWAGNPPKENKILIGKEMRFLRSVKGYTRLDKIRSQVIRKEL